MTRTVSGESTTNNNSPGRAAAMVQLREEIATLRVAVKARDDFISVAAHELRNPMTPLLGQIELLQMITQRAGTDVPQEIAQGVDRVDTIVRRYIRRTTVLLDISRLTSGRFRLDLAMIDASAALTEVMADFGLFAETAGSSVTIACEPGISGLFDRTALEEVAENLISNAIKYGSGRPIHVALNADAGDLILRVEDQGFGISAENQGRLFQQFERLVSGRSSTGFGLGLWVVGKLVEAMGGTITIDSRPDEGSTFTVRLPLQRIEGPS